MRDDPCASPISIYRLYAKAWRHNEQGESLAWEALAVQLVPYVADLGFTHVELMGLTEEEAGPAFARFVDACHIGGIGIIVEWPLTLTEPPMREHQILDAARDWLESFHLDGLRLMPVTSHEDEATIAMLGRVMEALASQNQQILLFCQYHWPAAVSRISPRLLIWNTGWSHSVLAYLSENPELRGHHHARLTDELMGAFDAHYVLPILDREIDGSDGEHGESVTTWFGRMPGADDQRFATLRACLGFMWAHPGKKLLGMGAEFAQDKAWHQTGELDWSLLDHPGHAGVLRLVADLNRIYGNEPSLHYCDTQSDSFAWIVGDDVTNSVIAFMRYGAEGTAPLLVVTNFGTVEHHHYRLGVPALGTWREILNTESEFYAGTNVGNASGVRAQLSPSHGYPASLELILPPLSTLLLRQGDWPS
ncbi:MULTISPECIES: alpha amylase C-terminal domain-containing protein [Halomonadaceae]|uniref:alpha amylase C-terminal domain-containing protein n=1 Tax=Halomonadaceae TaxID=28256 RepID=UPI0015973986|nr:MULTISPECIES: alpha amylase C-terminal domain-containing protein [Halomonas]QJQ95828.1 hypothetical protein HIO72_11470 [Halomonas sp. PA5]